MKNLIFAGLFLFGNMALAQMSTVKNQHSNNCGILSSATLVLEQCLALEKPDDFCVEFHSRVLENYDREFMESLELPKIDLDLESEVKLVPRGEMLIQNHKRKNRN